MEWFKKFKAELSRIFGSVFTDEMTEAEALDKLEAQSSMIEINKQLKDQAEKVDKQTKELEDQSKELADQTEKVKSLEESVSQAEKSIQSLSEKSDKAIKGFKDDLQKLKEDAAAEISELKDLKTKTGEDEGGKGLGLSEDKKKGKKVVVAGEWVSEHLNGLIGKR